ncbi:alpha/beta hydrolase family protein [Pedobacter nyackensis]|uniref:Prolyl oligopeptidase family protein n=1 Tax=Pedobacter nyackensis TaxID=475255 RepID=A0A1W2BE66_9SPHI|nr:prolyl oligopeptidase family serine peptidase [Pedobacter nyackensis]SMC70678.1 Prolyl oligopeptidase family protein [Pedobacter nyackensis]
MTKIIKYYKLVFFFLLVANDLSGQSKKVLDHTTFNSWKFISGDKISPNGKWFGYEIRNKAAYQVLLLGNREKVDTILHGANLQFSSDSKFCTYTVGAEAKNKVFRLRNLVTGELLDFKGQPIVSFIKSSPCLLQVIRKSKVDSTVKKNTILNSLVLYNPTSKDSVVFESVLKHRYSDDQNYVLVLQQEKKISRLSLFHIPSGHKKVIVSGNVNYTMATFSKNSDQLAYISEDIKAKDTLYKIYVVKTKSGQRLDSVTNSTRGLSSGYRISANELLSFSANGQKVYFKSSAYTVADTVRKKKVLLDIWKWDQSTIPPMDKKGTAIKSSNFYQYVIGNKKVVQLGDSEMPYLQFPEGDKEGVSIGFSDLRYQNLVGIEASRLYDAYLVNMETGKNKMVLERKYYIPKISFDKQYISWYEPTDSSWYSMNTKTLEKRNLTRNIKDVFYNDELDMPMHSTHYGDAGWDTETHWFLVHSKYDLWKIDASGKNVPVCLTKGTGRKQGIVFRYIKPEKTERYIDLKAVQYFTAFQSKTKKDGYFVLKPNGSFDQLALSDHTYGGLNISEDGTACLWKKGDFTEYPELYYSDQNFANIKKISITNPQQKDYNWGTSELVEWESFNKDSLQGILCKPENFDPSKKYPMIVYFYEQRSDLLHRYNAPDAMKSVVNWSYLVSNGYLVFIPDVVFRTAAPGASSYDAIVSGVNALTTQYDFIDKDRIGINGHSWGGYQAAYLITKTNMFKAAMAGAIVSNMTSAYGGIRWETGQSRMFQYEHTQSRMGTTLWSNPLAYISNSPLFGLPNVKTPVLMMHNDQDGSVPWEQGIEFFTGLRRLNKPAWMLNYKGEGHLLEKKENKEDFTNKVMGFFDYYLKDKPKPDWM